MAFQLPFFSETSVLSRHLLPDPLAHEGFLSTLCACSWLNFLESLELELFALLRHCNLVSHGVVGMHLSISHSNVNEALLCGLYCLLRSQPIL